MGRWGGAGPAGRRPSTATLPLLAGGAGVADGGLAGGQTRGRHPERRARHVVEADLVAEADRVGIAPVLAADAEVQVLPAGPALLAGDLHQPADGGPRSEEHTSEL